MPKIHVILLAAGKSSRFGQNKLLVPVGGKPLYQHLPGLIDQLPGGLIGLRCIVSRFPEILEPMKERNYLCVTNEMPEYGISHSIFLGIQKLMEQDAVKEEDALLFAVCDQPYLKGETLLRLAEGYWKSGKGIACVCDADRSGNPVIFSLRYAKELMELTGDRGGKQVLLRHPGDVYFCPAEDDKELMDIDTREAYRELCGGRYLFYHFKGGETSFLWELVCRRSGGAQPHIVSIAGAGGKTSMAYELAREVKELGKTVLVTTTTHMRRPKEAYYEWGNQPAEVKKQELKERMKSGGIWTVGRTVPDGSGKIRGIPAGEQAFLSGIPDILIVEADGSGQMPVKVPGAHEPALYPGTDFFVGVMGYPALGKPLKEAAHHPERAAAFLKVAEEHILTVNDLVNIMTSPGGLLKNVDMPYLLLVNRCPAGFLLPEEQDHGSGEIIFCEENEMAPEQDR